MNKDLCTIITGSGSYIPERIIPNSYFLNSEFYNPDGTKIEKPNEEIVQKFEEITCIKERRHVTDNFVTSDIGYFAALDCLNTSSADPEELDYIIFAHNFGECAGKK